MSVAMRVLFFLNGAVLTFFLVMPLFDRAISWREASVAVFACLFLSLLFGGLSVLLVPKKVGADPYLRGQWRRRWGMAIAGIGIAYSVILGPIVALTCRSNYEENTRKASRGSYGYGSGYGSGYGRGYGYGGGYDRLSSTYASYDLVGAELGWITTGMVVFPIGLLVVSLVRKPKGDPMASVPIVAALPPQSLEAIPLGLQPTQLDQQSQLAHQPTELQVAHPSGSVPGGGDGSPG